MIIFLYALAVVIVAGLAPLALALWSACVVSARISREEERRNG